MLASLDNRLIICQLWETFSNSSGVCAMELRNWILVQGLHEQVCNVCSNSVCSLHHMHSFHSPLSNATRLREVVRRAGWKIQLFGLTFQLSLKKTQGKMFAKKKKKKSQPLFGPRVKTQASALPESSQYTQHFLSWRRPSPLPSNGTALGETSLHCYNRESLLFYFILKRPSRPLRGLLFFF